MQLSHHPKPTLRTTARSRREGGYVLTMFALLLVPLLLMVGFAVDVGYWYNRASDMRRAADAAALAGVVWLPDVSAARSAALEAAAKNGFTPNSHVSITVSQSQRSERRLRVSITDDRVGSFFYKSLGGDDVALTRTSFAEYVLSVPMGSPRNFFGTGTLFDSYSGSGMPTEYLYQSVNPYCTDKVNGDRFQSGYSNYESSNGSNGTCEGTANGEYDSTGYGMYVEVPTGRTSPIEVRLYDARYNPDQLSWTEQQGNTCVDVPVYDPADPSWTGPSSSSADVFVVGPAQYQTRSNTYSGWGSTQTIGEGTVVVRDGRLIRYRSAVSLATNWTTSWSSSYIYVDGPALYQTRSGTSTDWDDVSSASWVKAGDSVWSRANRIRYKAGAIATVQQCTPNYVTKTEAGIDDKRQNGSDDYTYTLYAADNTPLDDSDNPVMCSKTFTASTDFEYSYLGSKRWNTLCTIPTTTLPGRYLLKVRNSGAVSSPLNDGSNQWGIVAKYTTSSGDGLCDGRNDTMCPRVFGKDAISVRAAANTSVASFYLAEIAAEHAGKKLRIELWDPGEGGSKIEIMKPSGTDGNSWTATKFDWTGNAWSGSTSGTNVSSIDVTSNRFNGRLIQITVDLTGYNPPTNNQWWQIRYTFSGAVTDRTTWSARIIGDPVHLVEEN